MQADESKVAALESIFGGQDITASVIRTVLSSNDNKFDDAVDSLLNMSQDNKVSSPAPTRPAQAKVEESEEVQREKREREKLKTLENMFGGDLTQSVICTVLHSNKGELVDTVDTLLNMTSKDINPHYADVSQRDIERARQEEELKNYEDFKRLQVSLQEEEARAIKEQQQRIEDDLRRSAEASAAEERRRREVTLEQERRLNEYEAQKKAQAELAAKENARRQEAEVRMTEHARMQAEQHRKVELEEAQEKLRRAWEEKLKLLNAEEEKVRKLQVAQQAEEEAKRRELLAREQACAEQEQYMQKARQAEEARLAERRAMLEAEEAAKAQEIARLHNEATQQEQTMKREQIERQRRAEEEARAFKQKLEDEENTRLQRKEQELQEKLEKERLALQKEKAELEVLRLDVELTKQVAEEKRLLKETKAKLKAAEEEMQRMLEVEAAEQRQRAEEEALLRRINEERRLKEEEERQELLKAEQEKEARRLLEEELRNQALKEEAEKQLAAFEEERRKKSVFDQLAASAVFIPLKAEATADQISISALVAADTVTAEWDLPEGNASATNWLGLYPIRALPNTNKYVQFIYTNGAHSGQHVFRGVTPGHYEVRFFATRQYEHAACSSTVRVGPTPTLSAQLQGDHLLVYYTLDPMSATPTREWLGIYEKTQRRNKKYLSSAYGNAEGHIMMKAPRTPGVYEVRLFATSSVYNEQAKCEFVVEDNDCINVDPTSVLAGSTNVNVSWVMRTVEPSSGDWIGLYKAEEANNGSYLFSTYTTGASVGSVTITAPKDAGVYELRLFARAKGRYTTFRVSSPLTVV